ncbi:uncharacterized protein [Bos indicus]|uniref:Translation initiation factor IF-2-like n=1 Tax=Bos indicus TaxID=9915 RepID=A0ABM4QSK4_BOSIN
MSATSDLKQSPFSSSDSPGSSPKHAHTLSADSSPPRKPRIEVEYLFGQSHHILRITVDFQAFWREAGFLKSRGAASRGPRRRSGVATSPVPAVELRPLQSALRRAGNKYGSALSRPSPRRRAHNKNKVAARAGAHRLGPGAPQRTGGPLWHSRANTPFRRPPSEGSSGPESPPRAPAEQLRGPPRTSPPLQASPNAPFAWRGFPERTPRVPAPPLQATEDRGPRLAVPRGGERSLSGLPSSERPAGRLGRERGWPHSPFPRAVRAPTPLPRARTCRPARPARAPPAPAARGRPPQTHLGRSGGGRPSSATWPGSRCERLRALAASTAAGRTGRHGPSCGRSARGLCRWAGALPAAPFRLRGTILWRFGAARRKPLTARVRRAAQ